MVGDKLIKESSIIIFSNIELVNGGSAGSARVMNYARAISKNCNVFLISFSRRKEIKTSKLIEVEQGIYTTGITSKHSNKYIDKIFYFFNVICFLLNISNFSKKINSNVKAYILYPSTKVLLDYLTVLIFIKIKKFKVFYEVNEIRRYSSNLQDNITLYKKYKKTLYKFSERITKCFSGLLCISINIEKYFKKYNKNTLRIPILSNIKKIPREIHKKYYSTNDIFKIGFFGSVSYEKENFDLFFQSLFLLKKNCPDKKFNVTFYGPIDKETKKILPKKLKKFNLENTVKYYGKLEQKSVFSVMREYHLLVLPRGNNLQNKYGFSTKLSEYLVTGVPVLVTDVSDNSLYINDGINGFVVPANDILSLSNKICYIIENYNFFDKICINAINTVKNCFSYNLYSETLKEFLCSKN